MDHAGYPASVSENGEPPVNPGGDSQSDWIDRVLERAGERADTPPIVPPAVRQDHTSPIPVVPQQRPITDELASIQWVEGTDVRPASVPIASQPPVQQSLGAQPTGEQSLTAQSVGRSAWDDDLRSIGNQEPEGWDKLSWQDMPSDAGAGAAAMPEPSVTMQLLREWGPVLIAAVAIALFTRLVLVQAYHIPSLSMAPTLQEGDRVIVNRLSYQFGDIERGQVIVFSKPPNQPSEANDLIKRVIGLPGETLQFRDGEVYVDGLLVQEPYLAQQNSTRPRSFSIPGCAQENLSPDVCTVPEGYVFMMGDNRTGSQDSRTFGPISVDTVVGRAFLRVWPLADVGQL